MLLGVRGLRQMQDKVVLLRQAACTDSERITLSSAARLQSLWCCSLAHRVDLEQDVRIRFIDVYVRF